MGQGLPSHFYSQNRPGSAQNNEMVCAIFTIIDG
jgi:hypothetical protein